MKKAFVYLFIGLGVFTAIGYRNISIAQIVGGLVNGTFTGIDRTAGEWNNYQRENEKRGIGKLVPYDGKAYNNNDY